MKTPKEIFLEAFALVKNPETWCQGAYALNAAGEVAHANADEACRWCSAGALVRQFNKNTLSALGGEPRFDHLMRLLHEESDGGLVHFNDTHSHPEVVALWERVGRANGWLS